MRFHIEIFDLRAYTRVLEMKEIMLHAISNCPTCDFTLINDYIDLREHGALCGA